MSFAATYSAATASMVVSPATTGTSCIGPQAVGVIAPEKDPVPVAPAAPAKSVSSAIVRMAPITSPGRSFMSVPPGVGENTARAIPQGVANRTFLIDGSVSLSRRIRVCVSLATLLLPAVSCGHKPSDAQALRTCVDRWNQGNMVGWGPGPANVAFRSPNAKEESSIGLSSSRQCIVATPADDGTWTCVLSSTGAYWCPPLHEATGPRLPQNATLDRRGALELDSPPKSTHPAPPLAWQRYPRVDGYVHPWTSSAKLRPGLRFKARDEAAASSPSRRSDPRSAASPATRDPTRASRSDDRGSAVLLRERAERCEQLRKRSRQLLELVVSRQKSQSDRLVARPSAREPTSLTLRTVGWFRPRSSTRCSRSEVIWALSLPV